jgi:hypothetical protein
MTKKGNVPCQIQLEANPFTCFFSIAFGWGTFILHPYRLEIDLRKGTLNVGMLQVTRLNKKITLQFDLVISAGER